MCNTKAKMFTEYFDLEMSYGVFKSFRFLLLSTFNLRNILVKELKNSEHFFSVHRYFCVKYFHGCPGNKGESVHDTGETI